MKSSRSRTALSKLAPAVGVLPWSKYFTSALASAPVASWVEKVLAAEVSQILRGPSTARLAKNARHSAQDDDFVKRIKGNISSREVQIEVAS